MVIALILAGGRGERFWPKSRKKSPKHLLKLYGEQSLLIQTIKRLDGIVDSQNIWVITNPEQAALIKKTDKNRLPFRILIEPEGKNTAAAIGFASIKMKKIYGLEATMLVLSADHWIGKIKEFKNSLRRGINLASREKALITVGVKATRPETGFGYIEKRISYPGIPKVFKVKRFIEKPELTRAKKLCQSSRYLWNSGIFIWKIEDILAAFSKHLPVHFKLLSQIKSGTKKGQVNKIYRRLKKISIDYGIMEKAKNVWVVEGRFLWDDVGSWTAWARLKKEGASGNILIGEIIPFKTHNSIIWSDKPLVATIGINNLIIIVNKDALLVCARDQTQDIKKIVAQLHQKKKWQRYT